jgi:hypothetical protein
MDEDLEMDGDDYLDDENETGELVTTGAQLDQLLTGAADSSMRARAMLNRFKNVQLSPTALAADRVPAKVIQAVHHITRIAKSVSYQVGKLDANELRRPNSLVGVYGTVQAPGSSVLFSITPSGGTPWYRLLAFLAGDDQAQIFGFSSLKVGGQDMVFATQTAPVAPVTNAVSWIGFVARGDNQLFNVAPWTGRMFDNSTPITGTIVNMSVAASGDAISLAPRFLCPSQTDPCGQSSMYARSHGRVVKQRLNSLLRIQRF